MDATNPKSSSHGGNGCGPLGSPEDAGDFEAYMVAADLGGVSSWLNPGGDRQYEVRLLVANLAMGYKTMLEDQTLCGNWKEHAKTLNALADQAKSLAEALQTLEEGARILWSHAESRLGMVDAGEGLLSTLPILVVSPTLSDFQIDEHGEMVCTKPPGPPAITPPDIDAPVRAC
ncbi:MAG: hypothetical protein IPN59_16890 [Holophaga sp.]|nr:hypothetical protein [Holophaga sp.]